MLFEYIPPVDQMFRKQTDPFSTERMREKVFRRRYRDIQGEEVRKFLLLSFLGDYVNLPNTEENKDINWWE